MPEPVKKSVAFQIFGHLTDEERLDHASELLAHGVLRLAQKRGLLKPKKGEDLSPPDEIREAA